MRYLFTLLSLTFLTHAFAQDDEYWLLKNDSTDLESYAYVDKDNHVKIPFGKYSLCFTDTFRTYAIVLKQDEGFIAIDRHEKKLFSIYSYDNGPDYVVEGMFRIVDNNKMGFADSNGHVIIPPIYDFAFAFKHGLALVNKGGESVSVDPTDLNCEYHKWEGGKWGVIDKMGKLVVPIEYECLHKAYSKSQL